MVSRRIVDVQTEPADISIIAWIRLKNGWLVRFGASNSKSEAAQLSIGESRQGLLVLVRALWNFTQAGIQWRLQDFAECGAEVITDVSQC